MSCSDRLTIPRRLIAFAAFLLMGLSNFGYAQTAKVADKPCGDYGTQSEMNDCAAREAQKADTKLNATFRELINKIGDDKTAKAKVIAAERAWIAFRYAELAAEWPVAQGENPNDVYGSIHPFCYYNEFTAMTLDRASTLRELMHHEDGDVCSSGVAYERDSDELPRRCHGFVLGAGIPGE